MARTNAAGFLRTTRLLQSFSPRGWGNRPVFNSILRLLVDQDKKGDTPVAEVGGHQGMGPGTTIPQRYIKCSLSLFNFLQSNLEFKLRQQEFIEFIRKDHRMEAVKHARKHFANPESDQMTSVQHVMGLLAFPTDTEVSPYKVRCQFRPCASPPPLPPNKLRKIPTVSGAAGSGKLGHASQAIQTGQFQAVSAESAFGVHRRAASGSVGSQDPVVLQVRRK